MKKKLVLGLAIMTATLLSTATVFGAEGWNQDGIGWRFEVANRSYAANEWKSIGNKWYYFNEDGYMYTGWLYDENGGWHYLKSDGAMHTGWLQYEGAWYYFKTSGALQIGWLQDNGKWYHLRDDGSMQTGWLQSNSKWYYLGSDGSMQTGWIDDDGNRYYLNETTGAMEEQGENDAANVAISATRRDPANPSHYLPSFKEGEIPPDAYKCGPNGETLPNPNGETPFNQQKTIYNGVEYVFNATLKIWVKTVTHIEFRILE